MFEMRWLNFVKDATFILLSLLIGAMGVLLLKLDYFARYYGTSSIRFNSGSEWLLVIIALCYFGYFILGLRMQRKQQVAVLSPTWDMVLVGLACFIAQSWVLCWANIRQG